MGSTREDLKLVEINIETIDWDNVQITYKITDEHGTLTKFGKIDSLSLTKTDAGLRDWLKKNE